MNSSTLSSTNTNGNILFSPNGTGICVFGGNDPASNPFHPNAFIYRSKGTTDGEGTAIFESANPTNGTVAFFAVAGAGVGYNASNCAFGIYRCGNGRSINAAGTINASGADYAEYMRKEPCCPPIAKGELVGINSDGELTKSWARSVRFVIKSTDPAYVGGDVWGRKDVLGKDKPKPPRWQDYATIDAYHEAQEQYEADKAEFDVLLDAARQTVDRIAYCGQVPVLGGLGMANPGDFIVPTPGPDNTITWKSVPDSELSMRDYIKSVGSILRVEEDGKVTAIVKIV
jgi:hypothetical protein